MTMTMAEIIRALIRESVVELRLEDAYADELLSGISPETTFGNAREATQFANDHIKRDIPELQDYAMTEYFPINEFKEKWMFEAIPNSNRSRIPQDKRASMASGVVNIVTIRHVIKDGVSYWNFIFAQAEQSMERMTQHLIYQTGLLDYDAMVKKVNEEWEQWG